MWDKSHEAIFKVFIDSFLEKITLMLCSQIVVIGCWVFKTFFIELFIVIVPQSQIMVYVSLNQD